MFNVGDIVEVGLFLVTVTYLLRVGMHSLQPRHLWT